MIILDTNVLSELMKSQPDSSVVLWFGKYQAPILFITTLTQAEILYGLGNFTSRKTTYCLGKSS